jgi:GT2 family glycosyltransferase
MMSVTCSIIFLNYNTKDCLERCLHSVFTHTKNIEFDVWVVDNASPDGSAAMVRSLFPEVHLIANHKNLFVAKGFNQGIQQSQGRYVFVGDADLEFRDNVSGNMVHFMDVNSTIGAVGCPFYLPDGSFYTKFCNRDYSYLFALLNFTFFGKVFRKTHQKLNDSFAYAGWDRKSSRYVDVLDTAIVYRRSVFEQIGVYDENFYFYGIQMDLCSRIRERGWGIYYLYDGKLIHAQHQSIKKEKYSKISKFYRKDISYLFKKRFGFFPALIFIFLLNITRWGLHIAIFFRIYEPKENTAFGTQPKK